MRVLALSTWWPEPADNGSRMRISQLLRALAARHEVHLVAFTQGPAAGVQRDTLDSICASVRATPQPAWQPTRIERIAGLFQRDPAYYRAMWDRSFAALVLERAAAVQPDAVIAFAINVAPYVQLVPGVPRILEEIELAYLLEQFTRQPSRLRKLRFWLTWAKHRAYVRRLLDRFDACTVASPREEGLVRSVAGPGLTVAVTPNGADVAGCETVRAIPAPDTLIYPGALSYDANLDAMVHFVAAIMPRIVAARPATRLRITGRASPEQWASLPACANVERTGFVPDVRPLIAGASAEVVPLRKGSGTRLKVLEALALGTPVVSTTKGVEGLALRHGHELLVADTPSDFAAATLLLLEQPGLRAHLAATGRSVVRERYDWRVIGARFEQLVSAMAGGKTYVRSAA